jgi:hypothetical protein
MLQLNISQRDAQIGLSTKDPLLRLRTTEPQVEISAPAATLEIHQADGVLQIDQTAFHNAVGQKTMAASDRDLVQRAQDHVLQVIRQMVSEGDQLSHIENRGNTIPQMIGQQNAVAPLSDVELVNLPPADIRYTPEAPIITVQPGDFATQLQAGTATGDLQPGTVDVYLRQNSSMKIWLSRSNAGNVDIKT